MKVVFLTNFAIFHQTSIWDSFCKEMNDCDEFYYLATQPLNKERKSMNYQDEKRDYIYNTFDLNDSDLNNILSNVDVLIYGCNYDKRIKPFQIKCKFFFFQSEHYLKKRNLLRKLYVLIKMLYFKIKTKGKRVGLLCNSSFVGKEFSFVVNKNAILKFGYFSHPVSFQNMYRDDFQILWSGRMLKWKKPKQAIFFLKYMLKYDDRYHLVMVGEGPEKNKMKKLAAKNNVANKVFFYPFLNNYELKQIMNKSGIYVFSSSVQEGWGVVLGEALCAGCLCVSSYYAGSTRYLCNNENSFVFKNNKNLIEIAKRINSLDADEIRKIRSEAIKTITECWNGEETGKRFYKYLSSLEEAKCVLWEKGPISLD